MPSKITWKAADEDEVLTAEDIDSAEEGYQAYAGEIAAGGVYRFKWRRGKYEEFSTGNQGLNLLLTLDGSWKPEHSKYDGCPLWDRVVMTKKAAAFAKAFAAALGVSATDLTTKVFTDKDGYVTKIGNKVINEDVRLYIAVKKGYYDDNPRLEIAGTGYQAMAAESSNGVSEDPWAEGSAKPGKGKAGKADKGKKGSKKGATDEPPF